MSGPAYFRKEEGRPSGDGELEILERRMIESSCRWWQVITSIISLVRLGNKTSSGVCGESKEEEKWLLNNSATSRGFEIRIPAVFAITGEGDETVEVRRLYRENRLLREPMRVASSWVFLNSFSRVAASAKALRMLWRAAISLCRKKRRLRRLRRRRIWTGIYGPLVRGLDLETGVLDSSTGKKFDSIMAVHSSASAERKNSPQSSCRSA